MLKIRLMGTRNDIKWFEKILRRNSKVEVAEFSELYPNKGTNKFYRVYVEVIKSNVQLIELLEQQNMQGSSQEMKEIYQYMAGMQFQLSAMAEELHNVKEQLSQAVDHQPVPVKEKLAKQAEQLEEKVSGLMERLMEMKNTFLDTAKQAIQTFREKGQAGLNKALNTGISSVKKMLSEYRNQLSETLMDFEKTANQIDSIGDEIKQIGNSTANIGRLLVGKGAKEIFGKGMDTDSSEAIQTARKAKDLLDKLTEYKPLAKVEELEEQNYNMIDNALNNKKPENEQTEKRERVSLKVKLAEKGHQIRNIDCESGRYKGQKLERY